MSLRPDLDIITGWIPARARVLDLGCGDGRLLANLRDSHQVNGYGLEIDPDNVAACVAAGVNVIQADLNAGLQDFESSSFDFVVMTQALQAVQHPDRLIREMLRIGRHGIVTFPNFAHWRNRVQLAWTGTMPVSRTLPNPWFSTPNIHLCTVTDFEQLCREHNVATVKRSMVDSAHRQNALMRMWPNLLAEIALYELAPV